MLDGVSLDASRTSEPTSCVNLDSGNIYVEWSGGSTPVGEVTVEARNGETGTWFEVDMGGTISVSGASGSHHLIFNAFPGTDIRIKYTRSSGTATAFTATITAKTEGA